jgi:RNA polymerase sigma-70 factor (ECF subfamily)
MTTNKLWELYGDDVKRFIFSRVEDINITEDLVQETFIKIHTKLGTLKDTSKIKSWVFSISRNIIIDYFRANNKVVEIKAIQTFDLFQDDFHSKQDCLPEHIKNLDKKHRTPIFLSDIKGIKQSEIALKLSLPLSTIKSRIQRARKKIALSYMDCCGYILNEKGLLVGEDQEKEDCKICR